MSFAQNHVELIKCDGLLTAVMAARASHDSYHKMDSEGDVLGPNDRGLLRKIIDNGHLSVLEHIFYVFKAKFPRGIWLEFERHRVGVSMVGESTRFTLKKKLLKASEEEMKQMLFDTGIPELNKKNLEQLKLIKSLLEQGEPVDKVKLGLPEAFMGQMVFTINARALRHMLSLRLDKKAHYVYQDLCKRMLEVLPDSYKWVVQYKRGKWDKFADPWRVKVSEDLWKQDELYEKRLSELYGGPFKKENFEKFMRESMANPRRFSQLFHEGSFTEGKLDLGDRGCGIKPDVCFIDELSLMKEVLKQCNIDDVTINDEDFQVLSMWIHNDDPHVVGHSDFIEDFKKWLCKEAKIFMSFVGPGEIYSLFSATSLENYALILSPRMKDFLKGWIGFHEGKRKIYSIEVLEDEKFNPNVESSLWAVLLLKKEEK